MRMAENFEANNNNNAGGRRSREEENEISRSGSDNMDGTGSGDEQDAADNSNPRKKKRYHRHTPQQIQELEAYEGIQTPFFLFCFGLKLYFLTGFFYVCGVQAVQGVPSSR